MQAWNRLPSCISPNKLQSLTSFHQLRVCQGVARTGTGHGRHGFGNLAKKYLLPPSKSRILREASEIVTNCLRPAADEAAINGALSIPQAELCGTNAECVTVAELGSVEGLAKWLEARIPAEKTRISSWGLDPGTKRVANLWTELVDGEISLEDAQPPRRTVHVASVKVRNEAGLYLIESHQEMADGRTRPRNRPLSEKMRPGENIEDACRRGVFEELGPELGASNRIEMIQESYQREEEERDSYSYPGLLTRYVLHSMVASVWGLPMKEFCTQENEGYPTNGALTNGVANAKFSENGHSGVHESAVGVKTHFWIWVTRCELDAIMQK